MRSSWRGLSGGGEVILYFLSSICVKYSVGGFFGFVDRKPDWGIMGRNQKGWASVEGNQELAETEYEK